MRSLILAFAALALVLQAATSYAAPVEKVVNRVPVVGVKPVKVLGVGGRVQGTLSRVDAAGKYFEVQSAEGLVKIPVNAKLKMQYGVNGQQFPASFDSVKSAVSARRIIVIVIRSGDTVIVIIIRTRAQA